MCSAHLEVSYGPRVVGVLTNNQMGQSSEHCPLCGDFYKACHVVPIALLVKVQCVRKSLYMALEGQSTRHTDPLAIM